MKSLDWDKLFSIRRRSKIRCSRNLSFAYGTHMKLQQTEKIITFKLNRNHLRTSSALCCFGASSWLSTDQTFMIFKLINYIYPSSMSNYWFIKCVLWASVVDLWPAEWFEERKLTKETVKWQSKYGSEMIKWVDKNAHIEVPSMTASTSATADDLDRRTGRQTDSVHSVHHPTQ